MSSTERGSGTGETTTGSEHGSLPPSPPPRRLSEAEREFVRWLVRQELKKWAA